MAKRSRFSRWRRLPTVFRFHEHKGPDPNLEPQRLTLYLTGTELDTAEALAAKAGAATLQEFCTELLQRAIEAGRINAQVANLEAQRGLLEGLHQIADDPEYLAEWSAQFAAQTQARSRSEPDHNPEIIIAPAASPLPRPHALTLPDLELEPEPEPEPVATKDSVPSEGSKSAAGRLSVAAETVLRHACQTGDDGPSFLASLRRGEAVPLAEVAELARALLLLENESREATMMDRRVVHALHRLAFESQVLHTDAWPGGFDDWTVDTLRAVQEAVDRILSGQDIRYNSLGMRPEIPL